MKLQIAKFNCGKCQSEFNAPVLSIGTYGEFLLRSTSNNNILHLDAIDDDTYDEVDKLLKENPYSKEKTANELAAILRTIYGEVACDLDENGKPYKIGTPSFCPFCDSKNIDRWELIEPPIFIDKDVKSVTHKVWNSLDLDQKVKKISDSLLTMA